MSYEAVIRDGTEQAVIIKDGLQYVVEVAGALGSQYFVELQGASGAVSAEAARQNALIALANAAAALVSAQNAAASETDAAASAAVADADALAANTSASTATSAEAAILAALASTTLTSLALTASDRTVLAALSTTSSYPAILTEDKRGGIFQLVDYATFSALVTADTQQGVFVRSTFNPAKVWARTEFLTSMIMHLLWFGAQFDGTFNDWPAMSGALALGAALPQISTTLFAYDTACPEIRLPYGHGRFYANSCILNDTVAIIGQSSGVASGLPTMIEWANGVAAFDVRSPGCRLENIATAGGFAGVEDSVSHVITGTHTPVLRNVYGIRWSGDGCHFDSSAANFDGAQIDNVFFENCRDAVFLDGPDTNVDCFKGVQGKSCRRWGLWDSGFLGNVHIAHQYAGCGITSYNDGVNIAASMVSYSGNWYFVIGGWDGWTDTHAPSGTTADTPGWAYYGAGGVTTGVPGWFPGIKTRAGGSVYTDNANAAHQIIGCYAEGGQPPPQIIAPSIVNGGIIAGQVWKGSTGCVMYSGPGLNALVVSTAVKESSYKGADEDFYTMLGGPNAGLKTLLYAFGTTTLPGGYRLIVQGNDLVSNYANGFIHYTITGPNTTVKYSRTANQPHVFNPETLAIGNGSNARIISTSDGTPGGSDIATGEMRLNVNPSPSGPVSWAGWMRTNAGTWRPFGGVAAAPTETYVAPTGGTTADTQCRKSLIQVRNDLADLRNKLQSAGITL